jgi:dienelactone hydrolase
MQLTSRVVPAVISLAMASVPASALGQAYEQVWIPMKTSSFFGGERTIKLEASLYKPKGDGPFPLVLYSHTSTGAGAIPASRTLRPDMLASFLTERGIAVLAPMRRGRGMSEGSYDEPYPCNYGSHSAGLENAIADTDAALAYAKGLPFVDQGRIVLAGASRGGMLSVVYATRRPGVSRAVVSFVGGWTSDRCSQGFHEEMFAAAGKVKHPPMLWLYAENDELYTVGDVRRYASVFEQAGGRLQLRLYPSPMGNGHFFYLRGSVVYGADLEAFLAEAGVIAKRVN